MRGGADRRIDHRHHLLDLVDDLAADIVDAVGEARGREVGLVDLVTSAVLSVPLRVSVSLMV